MVIYYFKYFIVIIIIIFFKRHFFHAKLWLDVCLYEVPPHIPENRSLGPQTKHFPAIIHTHSFHWNQILKKTLTQFDINKIKLKKLMMNPIEGQLVIHY